jgi:hypothetical protein
MMEHHRLVKVLKEAKNHQRKTPHHRLVKALKEAKNHQRKTPTMRNRGNYSDLTL